MERKRVNLDGVRGREFRIPAITGQGSGEGFDFSGLHLPQGWRQHIKEIRKIDWDKREAFFESICHNQGVEPHKITVDENTGVLISASIRTKPLSRIQLSDQFPGEQEGIYRGVHVDNLRSAIALQRLTATFLSRLWEMVNPALSRYFALIDGKFQVSYFSLNLSIPDECLQPEKPLTCSTFQDSFMLEASNIAGRFGLTLGPNWFDKRGILDSFDIEEGNACSYYLDPNKKSGDYHQHNVYTPEQVSALHGIGSSFINQLLIQQRRVGGYY